MPFYIICIALPIHPIRNPTITIQKPTFHAGLAVRMTKANEVNINNLPTMPPMRHLLDNAPAKLLKNSPMDPRTATPKSIGTHKDPAPFNHAFPNGGFAPAPVKTTYRNNSAAMNLRTSGHAPLSLGFAVGVFLGIFSQYILSAICF